MENQNPQVAPTSSQVPNSNPIQSLPHKKSKLIYIFWGMLVLLIVTIGATSTMYISKAIKSKSTPIPTITPSVTKMVPTEASIKPVDMSGEKTEKAVEASSWKTYTNNTFHFKCLYPTVMKAEELNKDTESMFPYEGGIAFYLIYNDNNSRPQASNTDVRIYDATNISLEKWINDRSTKSAFGTSTNKAYYGYEYLGIGIINGIEGMKFKSEVMGFTNLHTIIKKNNLIYDLGYIKVGEDLSGYYQKMLESFEFIN